MEKYEKKLQEKDYLRNVNKKSDLGVKKKNWKKDLNKKKNKKQKQPIHDSN